MRIKYIHKLLILSIGLILCLNRQTIAQNRLDSLIEALDYEISQRVSYDENKESRISALHELVNNTDLSSEQQYQYHIELIKEYWKYSFDQTLAQIEECLLLSEGQGLGKMRNETNLKLAGALGNAGRFKEAEDILTKINPHELSQALYIDFCQIARKIYSDLHFYAISAENQAEYKRLRQTYTDTLLHYFGTEDDFYLSIQEKKLLDDRMLDQGLAINSQRLAKAVMGTPSYSVITFERSLIYELKKNDAEQKAFLILSAISDIKASVKDNASLAKLAFILYNEGDIEKAYQYIMVAYNDALFFNSRLRFFEISKLLSLITKAYQEKTNEQKSILERYLMIISLLSLGLAIMLFFIYRQIRKVSMAKQELKVINQKLHATNESLQKANTELSSLYSNLSEANQVKELYIGQFLNICSEFIDKLDNYRRMTKRMLAARKYQALYDKINDKDIIDDEIDNFYRTFDSTFLSIYPNFIEEVNSLLIEGEQIKKQHMLNTELRVFALIRLGINDSSKIAKLLRYSVNTIYNYRAKVKNKSAVPREEFEEYILKINAFGKEK